jgi:hypothetical protein
MTSSYDHFVSDDNPAGLNPHRIAHREISHICRKLSARPTACKRIEGSGMTNSAEVPPHLLGDHRDVTWGDMSQYLVHFTKTPEAFARSLATGTIDASGPYGFSWARSVPQVTARHNSVCFSEVPLDKVGRLMRRHGFYGIAFKKEFIRAKQGARLWYVDQGSTQARSLNDLLGRLKSEGDFTHPMWDLTPFIDLVMPGKYEWDWEREWRVRGDLHFLLADVALVVTPEGFEELPALEGFYVHPKHDLIVAASPPALVEYMEDLVRQFFQSFEDPNNCLPVEKGQYVWIVEEWDASQAVGELFPALLDDVHERLVEYLREISWSWVLSADIASIYE